MTSRWIFRLCLLLVVTTSKWACQWLMSRTLREVNHPEATSVQSLQQPWAYSQAPISLIIKMLCISSAGTWTDLGPSSLPLMTWIPKWIQRLSSGHHRPSCKISWPFRIMWWGSLILRWWRPMGRMAESLAPEKAETSVASRGKSRRRFGGITIFRALIKMCLIVRLVLKLSKIMHMRTKNRKEMWYHQRLVGTRHSSQEGHLYMTIISWP